MKLIQDILIILIMTLIMKTIDVFMFNGDTSAFVFGILSSLMLFKKDR